MSHSPSFELKSVGLDGNTVYGHASVFGVVDSAQEEIMPSAFDPGMLREFEAQGFLLVNHDKTKVAGFISKACTDAKGLFFEAKLHSTPEAKTLRTIISDRLAHGKTISLSIGYSVLADRWRIDSVRELTKLRLSEISILIAKWPANEFAAVAGMKSHDPDAELRQLMVQRLRDKMRINTSGKTRELVGNLYRTEERMRQMVKAYPMLEGHFSDGLPDSRPMVEPERMVASTKGWPAGMETLECSVPLVRVR